MDGVFIIHPRGVWENESANLSSQSSERHDHQKT
jgi:hypothetical protein